jgi:2-polyprenyl-3-methyl-5-hydroxy-6-metoxy-1,4-benzoquinol methylase
MAFTGNENNRELLDSAAKVFRSRVTPGSRYHELLEGGPSAPAAGAGREAAFDFTPSESGKLNLPATEQLSRSTGFNIPQIGDMPPQPATIRGRLGAVLVSMVRRSLFWYTAQLKPIHIAIAESARELAGTLQGMDAQQRRQRTLLTETRQRVSELEASQERLRHLDGALASMGESAAARWERFEKTYASYREREGLQRTETLARLAQIDATLAATPRAQAVFEERIKQDLSSVVKELQQQFHEASTRILRQELRLKMLVSELRKHAGSAPAALVDEVARLEDPLFVDHAISFRGTRADIRNRLTVYLPYVREAFSAAMKAPAVDLGCGRGEWMELLTEAGIPAKGVDQNRELVSACRERGFDAVESEISDFLQTIPDESCSVVTAFHVVEHLPFGNVVELLDHAVRMLKPGGIAIFETPNPKNLFVSSNNFYMDPTHRNPIPSEFLAFLVEARGLCDPKVMHLSPYPDYFRLQESDCAAVKFINDHFFGPQDYGIVARKA